MAGGGKGTGGLIGSFWISEALRGWIRKSTAFCLHDGVEMLLRVCPGLSFLIGKHGKHYSPNRPDWLLKFQQLSVDLRRPFCLAVFALRFNFSKIGKSLSGPKSQMSL